jgi:tetratricopeptide (TPR) repeat protein
VKVRERVELWAGVGASIWEAHWLLFVGSFLVFSSAILKWVNFPFSRHPSGLQLPLLRNIELLPHLSLLSYGVLGACVLATGLVLLWRFDTFLAVAAAILIVFWVAAPCQIAFQQPALIRRLNAETQDLPTIRGFTKSYLPVNYGPAAEYSSHFELDTVWDRFVAAYSFLGLGWYCFGIGSFLIATYSVARLPSKREMAALAVGGIPIGVLIIFLTPAVIGQHYFITACTAQARGNNEKAIRHYRKAMWWDRWRRQDINIYATIGDLERLSGSGEDSPERHISRAEELKEAREYDSAVFELSQAAARGGEVAIASRLESARTRVDFGIALYSSGGIGAAVTQWQQALVEDPVQQQGLAFLIARGNYDLGRYQASLDALNGILKATGDKPLLANAYSLAGDCYMKLGRDTDARRSYNQSLKEDILVNFWAMSALSGD